MSISRPTSGNLYVAPFVGAWIEIHRYVYIYDIHTVAPFVGAWIEMFPFYTLIASNLVAPFVGAWIEMHTIKGLTVNFGKSLRSSERGLKFGIDELNVVEPGRSVRRSVD